MVDVNIILDFMYLFIYFFMFFCSIVWLIVFFENRDKIRVNPQIRKFKPLTFLLPAYNEERNIARCINSLLTLDYPKEKIKIIIIDDGSTDRTPLIAKEFARKHRRIRFLRKDHGGKASCLNHGLKFVDTEIFACMDADSVASKEYLSRTIGFFEDDDVGAVTPAMKLMESDTMIRKIQWVEYIYSLFLRKLFAIFDSQYVVPGPGGLYRTSVMKESGGFDEESLTEDMESAFKIVKKGYKIENSIDAFVYTDSPASLKGLYRQRLRWYRGYFQTLSKYSDMIMNPRYGNLGIFLLPMNLMWVFILSFIIFVPLATMVWNAGVYLSSLSAVNYNIIVDYSLNVSLFYADFYTFFFISFLMFAFLSLYLSLKYAGEKVDVGNKKLFYLAYLFIYPAIMSVFWMVAALYELLGIRRKW